MVNDSVRYLVEHVALRDALFSAGPRVILDFMDNPGPAMIELYKELGEETPGYESSSFTHTLTYTFGNATGTIATKTSSTSVSWTPSLTLANQIPNSTSGTVTITCSTYNGSTLIGSTTCTATLSVPSSVIPTMTSLTATRVDGTVPSSWGIYVQTMIPSSAC